MDLVAAEETVALQPSPAPQGNLFPSVMSIKEINEILTTATIAEAKRHMFNKYQLEAEEALSHLSFQDLNRLRLVLDKTYLDFHLGILDDLVRTELQSNG